MRMAVAAQHILVSEGCFRTWQSDREKRMLGAQPSPRPLSVPGLAKEPQSRKVAGMVMTWKGGEFGDMPVGSEGGTRCPEWVMWAALTWRHWEWIPGRWLLPLTQLPGPQPILVPSLYMGEAKAQEGKGLAPSFHSFFSAEPDWGCVVRIGSF